MRTVHGLIFVAVAAALALSGAKSLGSPEGVGSAYLAGKIVGAFLSL